MRYDFDSQQPSALSPRRVFGAEIDLVSDSPQLPRDDDVVQGVHDDGQEQAFLELERDGVVSHGPETPLEGG